MTRILRAALIAGLTTLALMVLPPVVNTTLAAECQCATGAATSEQATCNACVSSCASSGGMSRYGTVAGTRCTDDTHVDASSAPTTDAALSGPPVTPASGVQAADVSYCTATGWADQVKCQLLLFIAEILNVVASFIGKILVFLVDILISFASYNGFGDAVVVQRGWIVVRDVVNMFFIVVLLISAFATIIGYDEHNFHYTRVLPKLLLMAVLINFSRTLIQLLIDFSQVIMLTFVNAFASAGPGNLVAALKLDRVLAMAPPQGGGSAADTGALIGTVDPVNIILALMLAIFMLSVSLGVVIIMTAFLIVRIVGLWIALILSPIALFATALPGRLQKGLGAFTGKYWARLSNMLTGGPVMAFFLWLTFAITQSSVGEGGLAQAVNIQTNNSAVSFLTTVGNSQDIASFIVGITLLLMGLDAAISAADELSHTLGSFARRAGGASQAFGRLAAATPFLAGYYGARATGAAAGYAGGALNNRYNISGRAAAAALPLVNRIPGLSPRTRAAAGKAVETTNRARAEARVANMEGLKGNARATALLGSLSNAKTAGEKKVYAQQLTELAGEKNAQELKDSMMPDNLKQMTATRQTELQAQGLQGKALTDRMAADKDLIKNRASQLTDRQVAERQAQLLNTARTAAEEAKDTEAVRQIDEQFKKNPQLAADPSDIIKKMLADPKSMSNLSPQAKSDGGNLYELLKASGAVQENPDTKMITGFDRAKLDNFMDKVTDKEMKENLEMFTKLTADSPNVYDKQRLQQLVIGRDEGGRKRIFNLPSKKSAFLPAASNEPVISRQAQNAKTVLAGVKQDVGPFPASPDLEKTLRDAVVQNIKYNGLKETIDAEPTNSAVVTQFTQALKDGMANNDFSLVASVGKDIKGLSGDKQQKILEDIGNQITNRYKVLRSTGKSTKDIDGAYKNLVEVAVAIKNDADAKGEKVSANIEDMVEDIKRTLYSADDKERKQLPSSLKVIVEDNEGNH